MSRPNTFNPADFLPKTSRASLIARLQRPPLASQFAPPVVRLVLAIRLMANCIAARRDPLAQLACRFESIEAAKSVMDLAQACSHAWAENFTVNRPCCNVLTPDETVLAQMAEAAMVAERGRFDNVLDGLIRRERYERLYDTTQVAVAALSSVP